MMATPDKRCNSCGVPLVARGSVLFTCPNCGGSPVGRCPNCRDQSVLYRCSACGFEGP